MGLGDVGLEHLVEHVELPGDGDALVVGAGRELHDHLGARPLLGVVERPEPADDLDRVLVGLARLGRLLRHPGAERPLKHSRTCNDWNGGLR